VKENFEMEGSHAVILSHGIFCGSIAGTPVICNGYNL